LNETRLEALSLEPRLRFRIESDRRYGMAPGRAAENFFATP
jgi:hypothetical protein